MGNRFEVVATQENIIVRGLGPSRAEVLEMARDPKITALYALGCKIAERGGRITPGDGKRVAEILQRR